MHGWITSPSHKQTMLDEKYTRQGIGVAVASDDKVYITELFCSEIN
jgi:uncharacterized protein YkwD